MPRSSSARAILLSLLLALSGVEAVAETATIRGVSRIYLRTGPGTSHEPNGVVVEGEPLTTLERSGSWMKVETADGRVGYVYSGYLVVEETAASPPSASAEAPPVAVVPTPAVAAPTAVPAAPPAVFAVPEHETTVEANAGDGLREEIAVLKAEVERLKSDVASGSSDIRGGTAAVPSIGAADAPSGRSPSRRSRSTTAAGPEEGVNLRIAGVALFSLVLGWIFGAGFSRRRSRSTRGRLRY